MECRQYREEKLHRRGRRSNSVLMRTTYAGQHWKRWGPYVSERAWGTVREDYSPYGTAWEAVPHDHARSKAYRWNEDGLAGICDRHQFVCLRAGALERTRSNSQGTDVRSDGT